MGRTDRRTDGKAQTNMPPQLLPSSTEHSGSKNQKKKKKKRKEDGLASSKSYRVQRKEK